MRLKKLLSLLVGLFLLVPVSASAAINLSAADRTEVGQLAMQLLVVFNQLAEAQAKGQAYLNSSTFQAQASVWTAQLSQVQARFVAVLQRNVANTPTTPVYTPTYTPSSNASVCPTLLRTLDIGSAGNDVAELQSFLSKNPYVRYGGSISGTYDIYTAKAVEQYQISYGIISYGTPDSTGFGRVGPGTRASISVVCATGYSSTTPTTPVTNPPYTPPAPPSTVQTNYSTGELSIIPQLTGHSGGPNSVTFRVNMLPNSSCTSAAYTLLFGDGTEQTFSSSSQSCGNQIQQIPHVYPQQGTYTAKLKSGSFQTSLQVPLVTIPSSISLSASTDQDTSYGANISMTFKPGNPCRGTTYTVNFGDSSTQSVSFADGCDEETQDISHVYSGVGPFLISASDSEGRTVTTSFTAVQITSAGAGDPFQVLLLTGNGANNATNITDTSPKANAITVSGAKIDTTTKKYGTGSIRFNGASYISTPSDEDFKFGSGAFTINFWFNVKAFPAAQTQAALVMQSSANAADTTLGGMGLELFGNQLYYVGRIGTVTYHPFYGNSIHTGALKPATWYHVALVRTGNAINLYLNGASVGSILLAGNANVTDSPFTFGRYGDYSGNYFNGWIDQVEVSKGKARWTGNFSPTTGLQVAP